MFTDLERDNTSRIVAELKPDRGHRVLLIGPRSEDLVFRLLDATGGVGMSIVDPNGSTAELGWPLLDDAVSVSEGDGHDGAPGEGLFDRIACMVGVAGVPPAWIEQLAPEGLIVAPIAHAGTHPLFAITTSASTDALRAELRVVGDSEVGGPRLRPHRLFVCEDDLPELPTSRAEGVNVTMSPREYENFRVFAGTREPNIVACRPPGSSGRDVPLCALVDPAWGAAWLHRNGSVTLAGRHEVRDRLVALAWAWHEAGRPAAEGIVASMTWRETTALWLPDWPDRGDEHGES